MAIGDGFSQGRIDEGKLLDPPQMQREHAQDHPGQRTAQDFWVGKARSRQKARLVIQPNAHAVGDPATATGTLVRRSLADGLDLQLLDLVAVAVTLDPRHARVDDIAYAWHGQ